MTDRHRDVPQWIRLHIGLPTDPRILRVPATAELLYVRMLCTSRVLGTDGHLTTEQQRMCTRGIERRAVAKGWEALIREGLVEPCDDGIRVPFDRWRRWQDTEEEMEAARERARIRKAEWRARHRDEGF